MSFTCLCPTSVFSLSITCSFINIQCHYICLSALSVFSVSITYFLHLSSLSVFICHYHLFLLSVVTISIQLSLSLFSVSITYFLYQLSLSVFSCNYQYAVSLSFISLIRCQIFKIFTGLLKSSNIPITISISDSQKKFSVGDCYLYMEMVCVWDGCTCKAQ